VLYTKGACRRAEAWLTGAVKAPTEGLLDSRFLLSMSDMGAEMTRTMRVGADAFDLDDFMHRVARFMGGEARLARRGQRAGAATQDELIDEELAAGDVASWDWGRLGALAAQHTRRAPVSDFLLGPLQVSPKHRKQTRRALLDRDAEQVAPEQLGEQDVVRSENETSRLVLEIYKRLEEVSGDEGINLFAFAFNPHSFSNSVENLFYISFLVRDGKAAIYDNEQGDPMLMLSEEPTEEDRSAGLTRRQIILELDEPTWRTLVQLYDIREPMIPTREAHAPLARPGAWYG